MNQSALQSRWTAPIAVAALTSLGAAAIVQNRSRKALDDNPPVGSFVEVDGVRLHYVERGQGEPLVLLHGNMTMALDFMLGDFVDLVARKCRVIIFDRPGYGHSERPRGTTIWGPEAQAELIRKALPLIGVEKPVVLGHSWGAMVAMALALNSPESVRSLVLESGYYYPTPRPDAVLASPPAIPVLGDLMRHTFSPLLYRTTWPLAIKWMFAPAEVPDYFWDFPAWMALRPSQLRTTSAEIALVVPSTVKLSPRYKDLKVPLVILAGSEDRMVHPDAHSERLHQELPWADYRVVQGMGHMLHHLVPEQVAAAVDAAATKAQ